MKKHHSITIIIDTREQTPWMFPDSMPTIRDTLPTGDYSIEGKRHLVCVERKTLNDFVNTVIQGRKRFVEELKRMQAYPYKLVVIEASIEDILRHRYTSKASPTAVLATAISLQVEWGVGVVFAGTRGCAAAFVEKWLTYVSRVVDKSMRGHNE